MTTKDKVIVGTTLSLVVAAATYIEVIQNSALEESSGIISTVFTPVDTTNIWAEKFLYPVVVSNAFGLRTNKIGGYRADWNMTIEWESITGKTYTVEASWFMQDSIPMLCTNWTNISMVTTCGWWGEGWLSRMIPIQATNMVTRVTIPVWGYETNQQYYRIKEL